MRVRVTTPEQASMAAASRAVLKIIAASKNRRTLLSTYRPAVIAYHAAHAAVSAYKETMEQERRAPE